MWSARGANAKIFAPGLGRGLIRSQSCCPPCMTDLLVDLHNLVDHPLELLVVGHLGLTLVRAGPSGTALMSVLPVTDLVKGLMRPCPGRSGLAQAQ